MIDFYRFGKIVIDGTTYTSDVIIYPDRVDSNWWREKGHLLQVNDLGKVIKSAPTILVIGTGAYELMEVPDKLLENLKMKGIEVVVKPTKKACESYNKMNTIGKEKVTAALHLTC